MVRRMRVVAPFYLLALLFSSVYAVVPGLDGHITKQEALEGGNTTLLCNTATSWANDEFLLLVWYQNDAPIYSYDTRGPKEWSSKSFNVSGRLNFDLELQPTALTIHALMEDDQALYHCRVDFLLSPTRNLSVNLTVIVLPNQPFFLNEVDAKVENKVGPYHEGDTLVLNCFVVGGRPPPHITWYSGEILVDATDGESDIPGVKENKLYLPLTRDNAETLSCRASNTLLADPVIASLQVELYLPVYNVSIHWVERTSPDNSLQAGRQVTLQCQAEGSYPAPDLSWWLDHRRLTQHINQTWSNSSQIAVSYLEYTPSVQDNGATLSCVASNPVMAPSRGPLLDDVILNVTFSPIIEVLMQDGVANQILEMDSLHLECKVLANPPVGRISWYHNDIEIVGHDIWGDDTTSQVLTVEMAERKHDGNYSCSAQNSVGETRAESLAVTVLYPPECVGHGVFVVKETIHCEVRGLPMPDTYFWHIKPSGLDGQNLTTGSAILPLSQLSGPLVSPLKVICSANNGFGTQHNSCVKFLSLDHLKPPQPQQCDIAFEYEQFQMRCIPVENATYYEVTLWRISTSNSSLVLERRGSMGTSGSQPLAREGPWLVRGALGQLRPGDEAGAAACNRYGCSRATLLRPTEKILKAGETPWWHFFLEKDVDIALGAVVLIALFLLTTALVMRLVRRRRKPRQLAPVIQVLQLDEAARDYLDYIGDQRLRGARSSRSFRSCSSDSEVSLDGAGPAVDRRRKPRLDHHWDPPPPDVTLTLHRESAV